MTLSCDPVLIWSAYGRPLTARMKRPRRCRLQLPAYADAAIKSAVGFSTRVHR